MQIGFLLIFFLFSSPSFGNTFFENTFKSFKKEILKNYDITKNGDSLILIEVNEEKSDISTNTKAASSQWISPFSYSHPQTVPFYISQNTIAINNGFEDTSGSTATFPTTFQGSTAEAISRSSTLIPNWTADYSCTDPCADSYWIYETVAFGVRNYENLEKGMREMNRVLRPGGKLVVLEFSRPTMFPFKQLYNFYFKNILPTIGKLTSKDQRAYTYLYESVQAFPDGKDFLTVMNNTGYSSPDLEQLTLGICTLYTGTKK